MGVAARYRIAIIESESALRDLLAQMLTAAGHDVVAVSGVDALDRGWRGDVILTDTFAKPYRTNEAIALVRSLRDGWDAAIVVITAHSEAKRDEPLLGADAVMSKPFDVDEFVALVERTAGRGAR